jgi:DNA helicase-2/ATP-dependent DNA helicase PcrA
MWEFVETMAADAATTEEKTLAKKTSAFTELIRSLALRRSELTLYEFGREVATRTGIIGGYKADGSAEAISALENIEELLNSMVGTPTADYAAQNETDIPSETGEDGQMKELTLEDWLGSVALMTDMDTDNDDPENRNKVTLMTVHSAKGLEFRRVFIIGLEEDLFPSLRGGDRQEVEEERRLFYVALTRAKERAYVSLSTMRFLRGTMDFRRPSRFLEEIDATFIDEDGRSADGNKGGRSGWNTGSNESRMNEKPAWETRKPDWSARKPEPPQEVVPVAPDARFRKISSTGARTSAESSARGGGDYEPGTRVMHTKLSPSQDASTTCGDGRRSVDEFSAGTRVMHTKFGHGTVNEVEVMAGAASARDLKITVTFDDPAHGRKTLLSKFAKLEILM